MGLPSSDGIKRVVSFTSPENNGSRIGEYSVEFQVYTGSVIEQCQGYTSSTEAAFFVETNKNTYWLNPSFDGSQYFTFDSNGYRDIMRNVGLAQEGITKNPALSYYNPARCQ